MDERELVKGVLESDQLAQEKFFSLHRLRLYRTCVHFLGFQDSEAEDIVQETFLIALKKLPEFDFQHKLISWLTKITVNLCYERIRERKRMILLLEQDIESVANIKLRQSEDPEEDGGKMERIALIRGIVGNLGRICKRIIELRDWQGKSYIDISKSLRMPLGTVMSRLHRCRALLRQQVHAAIGETG